MLFSLFLPNYSVFEGATYPCHRTLCRVYYDLGREFSFNNINLSENNFVQVHEFIFWDSER